MTVSPGQPDILKDLRRRTATEGSIFWLGDDDLALFDPEHAQAINELNFSGLTLPEKLCDLLLGRRGEPIYWEEIRGLWGTAARRLAEADDVERLAERMDALLDERAGRSRDLVWVAQEVISRSLIPVVIDGLEDKALAKVQEDQDLKIRFNVEADAPPPSTWQKIHGILVQIRVGTAVRRELRGRAAGRRPRRRDLADPIVDRLPDLGMGRAVEAVTGVLTAIAGPPGGAGACLLYALARYPEWAARLREEHVELSPEQFYAGPAKSAPLTWRFVRETLRLWSPTPIVSREVRKNIEYGEVCLHAGQRYALSPDILHHDPRHYVDPQAFDPDRWLPGSERGPRTKGCYVPFGWAPRTCLGAGLGTIQLLLLCRLLSTRYTLDLDDSEQIVMALASMPVPQNLHGILRRL